MEYQMITKIVSKIQKDKRPNATSVFKLFSLFMVRWQWHGQVNQLPCPSEGKQSKSRLSLIHIFGYETGELRKNGGLDNASVTILTTDDFEHYHLDTWNDISYMED